MNKLLDLYTDYLQVTFGQASATGLSNLLDVAVSHKRWSVEEYHKSSKQNTAIGKSPIRTTRTQLNHLFSSMPAYVKFETEKKTG